MLSFTKICGDLNHFVYVMFLFLAQPSCTDRQKVSFIIKNPPLKWFLLLLCLFQCAFASNGDDGNHEDDDDDDINKNEDSDNGTMGCYVHVRRG